MVLQLRGFEFAKAVTLTAEPFSVDNGLMTPTFKVRFFLLFSAVKILTVFIVICMLVTFILHFDFALSCGSKFGSQLAAEEAPSKVVLCESDCRYVC